MTAHTPSRRGEVEASFKVRPSNGNEPTLVVVAASSWPSADQGIEITISETNTDVEVSMCLSVREAAKFARWISDTLGLVNHA